MLRLRSKTNPPVHGLNESKSLHGQLTVRMIVAVPALLALLVIAFGYTSLSILFHYAAESPADLQNENPWGLAQKWTIVSMLVFFLIAILAGLGVAFSILGPLRSISQALERASQGALASPVRLGGGWEIDSIGRSFNSMIQYLNKVFQERNRYLLDSARSATLKLDHQACILEMNAAAEEFFEAGSEDLRGQSLPELLNNPSMDDERAYLIKTFLQVLQTPEPQMTEMQTGNFVHFCKRELTPEGKSVFLLTFRDVSRGQAMQQLLARTDQLAALGAFTMGLSHELRNPLGSIKGLAQLLEESDGQDEASRNFASRIVHEVDRMDRFIRELLDFGQQSSVSPAPCDLAQLAAEALNGAKAGSDWIAEKNLEIIEKCEKVGPVLLQKERILRALTNIILNGMEATTPGHALRIATFKTGKNESGHAICEIENDGAPIPQQDLERIFEPFYTTKPKGTGLGLAMASQIVVQNGGILTAHNTPTGVRFVLTFPLTTSIE